MVHIHKEKRGKLDPRSEKMIFTGYDNETKGYRCVNKNNRKITISRDVIFHETALKPRCTVEFTSDEESSTDADTNSEDKKTDNGPKSPPNVPSSNSLNNSTENQSTDASDGSSDSSNYLNNTIVNTINDDQDSEYHPDESIPVTTSTPARTRSRTRQEQNQVPSILHSHFVFFTTTNNCHRGQKISGGEIMGSSDANRDELIDRK